MRPAGNERAHTGWASNGHAKRLIGENARILP